MKSHSKAYFENENMCFEKWKVINTYLKKNNVHIVKQTFSHKRPLIEEPVSPVK